MLLCEITVNGTIRRVSIEGHPLTHNWKPYITNFDAPTFAVATNHGGYAEMVYGTISFNPKLFYDTVFSINDYPPPVSCPISIYYTDTTEAAAELIFAGTAHRCNFNREQVTYALYGSSYDSHIYIMGVPPLVVGRSYEIVNYVDGDDFTNVGAILNQTGEIFTATGAYPTVWTNFSHLAPHWNDTLNNVIADVLSEITEITTLNTDYARVLSPNVLYTLTSTRMAINVASDIAAFYSHLLYVIGDTAYLVDMKLSNGSDWTLTEYQFFSTPSYELATPRAAMKTTYNEESYYATSIYPYGETSEIDPYHQTEADIEAALADILAFENTQRMVIKIPMIAGNFPRLGQKIIFSDTSHITNLLNYIKVRQLQYDFINDEIIIEGEGEVVAA